MAKPAILAVDDDLEVLGSVQRDLQRHYGEKFRVLRADSGAAALDTLNRLKLRNDPLALFVVDQRMPQMEGVDFLKKAITIYPEAKRTLLTAYADTEAAIRAINDIKLDYYLKKPWDPPEENLYPVLDDLLYDWQATFTPPFEGVRVVGTRWSPLSHNIKDFLSRNQIPYQWLDIETDEEARKLVEAAGREANKLPLVLFPNGSVLAQPTNAQLGEKIGLRAHAGLPFYDLIIVGGGPAGLAAAVYGASEGLKTLLVEREATGGQAGMSSRIENYLGFPAGLSGSDLARRAVAQASRFGAEILTPQEVAGLRVADPYRYVKLGDGNELSCKSLVIATGVTYRKLDVPGIDALTGAGVYYGAARSEAAYYKGEDVYIVGGANSAGQAAMYFSQYARTVTLILRGDSLAKGMSQYLVDQIADTPNIRALYNSNVTGVHGDNRLQSITVANSATGESQTLPTSALLIFIGAQPHTEWVSGVLERDSAGFILSGSDLMREGKRPAGWTLRRDPFWLEASAPGVFVAGDVRHSSVKRMASAVGEGAMAVQFVHQYLLGL